MLLSHLELAKRYWKEFLQPGQVAIDATAGNGYDTLTLARLALTPTSGHIITFDIQPQALANCRALIAQELDSSLASRITYIEASHSTLEATVNSLNIDKPSLIVYNFGYLPGGDKTRTTDAATSLESIYQAERILKPGGAISLTLYPGHPAGAIEESAIVNYARSLERHNWSVCLHDWINREKAPKLLLLVSKI